MGPKMDPILEGLNQGSCQGWPIPLIFGLRLKGSGPWGIWGPSGPAQNPPQKGSILGYIPDSPKGRNHVYDRLN